MRFHPEAITISSKTSAPYADILRKAKADPYLKGLGRNLNRIRRNQKRNLMLQLKSDVESKAKGYRSQVENLLGENPSVPVRKHEIATQCKDLGHF